MNITVERYCDRLDVGLIGCRQVVPDLALLADRLAPALVELEAAVVRHARPASPRSPDRPAAVEAPAARAAQGLSTLDPLT